MSLLFVSSYCIYSKCVISLELMDSICSVEVTVSNLINFCIMLSITTTFIKLKCLFTVLTVINWYFMLLCAVNVLDKDRNYCLTV